jgi:glyoxylase-like metal-dependent hydrolase (beta-lactamase superfamily II)
MTEPSEVAEHAEPVVEGLYHWRIHNSHIGGSISSSQALQTADGLVLVDPVRLEQHELERLGRPAVVALTAKCHQRAAWRYRREYGAQVWLPQDAPQAEEEPDERYAEGDLLPGGLRAFRTPGPEWPHYSFLREGRPGVVFVSDLIGGDEHGLRFIPPQYHEDPDATQRSVEGLLDLPFGVMCLAHGAPLTHDPKAALRTLLDGE